MKLNKLFRILMPVMAITVILAQFAIAAPTVEECKNAWNSSSASDSCGLAQVHDNLANITVNSSGECAIHVDCSTAHWGVNRTNNWSGSKEDMANLRLFMVNGGMLVRKTYLNLHNESRSHP